jgi:hypothetical protein
MAKEYSLETSRVRLQVLEEGKLYNGFTLQTRVGKMWRQLSKTTPLSHLIYQDNKGKRQEVALNANSCKVKTDALELQGDFKDRDSALWHLKVTFALTEHDHQMTVDYRLETDKDCKVLRWTGPCLYAGEGSFGSQKDEALFPGLEYLINNEVSSDTRFAAEKYANRLAPHAYKMTMPLMAVSFEGCAVGLMWEPNRAWEAAWRHPAAMFSSPNRSNKKAKNHWLALSTPSVEPRWRNEGDLEAHKAVGISPKNPHHLAARLIATPEGGVSAVLREWVAAYGLPKVPEGGQSYRDNVELCIESYLEVAWDEETEGWHHTLADPWEPRFEPILANQLWRYSRWSEGESSLKARARDQVQRAFKKLPTPHHTPRLELALCYGNVASSLESAAVAARDLIKEQQKDGSWGWTPEAVANVADFKTKERVALMGKLKDSATGFTSSKVIPVLSYALATGEREATASVVKAADWCNKQKRPEGAQTWELHLHVPDVLAVPYLINLNLGAYQLTNKKSYLEAAKRWAWTGLPFTFLWNPYYRPVMRYGTVPVFGVTFHDVQSWFGVIVHWNGLWYSDALFRLATFERTDGPIDWLQLAEGIVQHGLQEQAKDGPYKGMYPDAFSTVRGDEEYTWWLNPQLIGLNTFPLAGLSVHADPVVLHRADGARVHLTSGANIVSRELQKNHIDILLKDQPHETSYTLIASETPPVKIVIEGRELEQVSSRELETMTQGWTMLEQHKAALVKLHFAKGAHQVRCHFA